MSHRAGRIAKERGCPFTRHSGRDRGHAMQAVIMAGILMTVDFLLERPLAVFRIGERQWAHVPEFHTVITSAINNVFVFGRTFLILVNP
jgi:hypothetical protein